MQAIFKYSTLVFDVAGEPDATGGRRLYARLREGSTYDAAIPLDKIRHTSELPAFVFRLGEVLHNMLRLNGAVLDDFGSWSPTLFPEPVVFEPTEERGDPQAGVYAVAT